MPPKLTASLNWLLPPTNVNDCALTLLALLAATLTLPWSEMTVSVSVLWKVFSLPALAMIWPWFDTTSTVLPVNVTPSIDETEIEGELTCAEEPVTEKPAAALTWRVCAEMLTGLRELSSTGPPAVSEKLGRVGVREAMCVCRAKRANEYRY